MMYNLLVVDDEEIAVRGIVQGIDWSDLPLGDIRTAYDVEEAKQVFRAQPIHILISDIDMPDDNGIGLLRWVKEHSPDTETIFLTGHADFAYAQQALQLDGFDYLLKPIDHRHIKSTLHRVIEKFREERQQEEFRKTYEHYYQQWNKQLPLLVERFWQDAMNQRISLGASHLASAYSMYHIPLAPEDQVALILLSVEEWSELLNTRDEEIMTYAIKNAGEEIILHELQGQLIYEAGGILFTIVYAPRQEQRLILEENCQRFIEMCRTYLHCEISCYVGEPVDVAELHTAMLRITSLERNYMCKGGSVIWEREYKEASTSAVYQPSFDNWGLLLETGKRQELLRRVNSELDRMERHHIDPSLLEGYYHGLVYMVYETLQKRAISMKDVYPEEEWRVTSSTFKSLQRFREWAVPFVQQAVDYMNDHGKAVSSVIQKAIAYIEEHIAQDLDREEIAGHVYLNPAYLSRLFKKETGRSLTDYIVEARIAKVKPMLESTNLKISDIAVAVGYDSFSHFTKTFKKLTGLTPQEYRRRGSASG